MVICSNETQYNYILYEDELHGPAVVPLRWSFTIITDDFLVEDDSQYMSAQTIWMMAFTRIMAILTPGISLQDHLNGKFLVPNHTVRTYVISLIILWQPGGDK